MLIYDFESDEWLSAEVTERTPLSEGAELLVLSVDTQEGRVATSCILFGDGDYFLPSDWGVVSKEDIEWPEWMYFGAPFDVCAAIFADGLPRVSPFAPDSSELLPPLPGKAQLRAWREMCGISQAAMADAVGASVKSVKRWEAEGDDWPMPDDAVEYLVRSWCRHRAVVEDAVRAAEYLEAAREGDPVEIQISYFRSQKQYDEFGRDKGDYAVANASSRASAEALLALGFTVRFVYPGDPGNVCRKAEETRTSYTPLDDEDESWEDVWEDVCEEDDATCVGGPEA